MNNKKNDKCKEIFGLLKIPDKDLLKLSRIEVGKLTSYISELEYKIKELEMSIINSSATINPSVRESRLHEECSKLNKKISEYKEKIEQLNSSYNPQITELLDEINKKDKKISHLSDQLMKSNKSIESLTKTCIELTKKLDRYE